MRLEMAQRRATCHLHNTATGNRYSCLLRLCNLSRQQPRLGIEELVRQVAMSASVLSRVAYRGSSTGVQHRATSACSCKHSGLVSARRSPAVLHMALRPSAALSRHSSYLGSRLTVHTGEHLQDEATHDAVHLLQA